MKGSALILGCVPRIAVPIARSLHRQGVLWDVTTFSENESSPRSRVIRGIRASPGPRLVSLVTFRLPFAGFFSAVNMKF